MGSFGGASLVVGMLVEGEAVGFWVRPDGGFGNLEEPEGSVFFFFPAFLKKTVSGSQMCKGWQVPLLSHVLYCCLITPNSYNIMYDRDSHSVSRV